MNKIVKSYADLIQFQPEVLSALWVKSKFAESAMRMSLARFVIVDNFINSTASSEKKIKKTGLKFFSVTDESCCLWRGSNGKLTLRQFQSRL